MDRLTNHFSYCECAECKYYDEELAKCNKCKIFITSTGHCHDKKVWEKLRDYEDLEEQGLLLKLPCKAGDKLYDIRQNHIKDRRNDMVHELSIEGITVEFCTWETWMARSVPLKEIGKTVFLTKEEAEEKLKELNISERN